MNEGWTALCHLPLQQQPLVVQCYQRCTIYLCRRWSVKEIPGFGLGTSSHLPNVSDMVYMDMRTGEMKKISLYDATASKGNQLTVLNRYRWDNGLEWKITMKYDHVLALSVPDLMSMSRK